MHCLHLGCRRREEVVDAMRHAWSGYEQHAWGHDELCPVSKKGKNSFGGLGATIVDSLDTLHMMGGWVAAVLAGWLAVCDGVCVVGRWGWEPPPLGAWSPCKWRVRQQGWQA